MSAARRGNPYLQIRLSPDVHDKLKTFVGEADGGKAGGVSLFVRRLIYRELLEPLPSQWSKELRAEDQAQNELVGLCLELERWEQDSAKPEAVTSLKERLKAYAESEDGINRNLALMMLGKLAIR